MAPKMCVIVALNVVMFFALVSGCDKCPPVTNTSITTTSITVTSTPSLNATTGCPRDVLKLGVCSGILNGWMNFSMGLPLKTHCCSAIEGLYDFEVALCVCTALKANIMGINLDIPISFTKLINTCDKKVPNGFICD
ncbi:hypothetical protein AAZX31_20G194800 [Glycine max]|nr:14 kDa proline-rich protein DC2.15 [Glycine max]XP_028220486.1 14 kDa proline-rich protein DC2.15-like [Glycine soja]KAG4908364.1 hypothetical protein JHK86_056848 [Glycine max]KAG4919587.1 hypothetical protein JHK85_057868 [Glycine max]KAG5075676.1 hypothetical protein JHK84_056907 [Glycine max]KAG5078320.1 hypothetical protein JHK82_057015 [Glycine max]|eukprot:XP_006606931.1 14 kDa proline-rich protein DC2.15 [Glycine max]